MALVGHSLYRIDRDIGGMGDMDGFFGDVWGGVKKGAQVAVNVGRILAVPVTGGASLLVPKAHWADKPKAPPPPPVDPEWAAAVQEAAHAVAEQAAATSAPLVNYTATNAPRSYAPPPPPPQVQVQPLSAGHYMVPPQFFAPPLPQPSSGLPSWLLPAGLGAGVLVVAYLALRKKGP